MTIAVLLYSIIYPVYIFIVYFFKQDFKLPDTIALSIGAVASVTYSSVVLYRKKKESTVFTEICFTLSTTFAVWFLIHSIFQFWKPKPVDDLHWVILILSPVVSIIFLWMFYSTRDCCKQWVDHENRVK